MEIISIMENYFLLFMIYAIAGWCVEEVHCSIHEKKIVDRGFLIGPICPIYGFGGVGITFLLSKFSGSPITVFCMAVIFCAILEYLTSYIMEKIFNARWWDYSKDKFNINGRICIRTLIPFGIFGLLVIYLFDPLIYKAIEYLGYTELLILTVSLLTIFILDCIISFFVISEVTSKAKNISKANPKDDTNEITEKVKEELRETFAGKRLVDAYPDFVAFRTRIKEIAIEAAKKGNKAIKNTVTKSKRIVKYNIIKGRIIVRKTANKGREVVKNKVKKNK